MPQSNNTIISITRINKPVQGVLQHFILAYCTVELPRKSPNASFRSDITTQDYNPWDDLLYIIVQPKAARERFGVTVMSWAYLTWN